MEHFSPSCQQTKRGKVIHFLQTNYIMQSCFLSLLFLFITIPLLAQDEYQDHEAIFMKIEANIKEQVALWVFPSETPESQMSSVGDIEVVGYYQDGVAVVKYQNKYGFVNKYGQYIAAPEYQEVQLFCEGYAPVKHNGKWSFINQKGALLTDFVYEYVGIFNLGLAAVKRDGKWGVINQEGVEVVVPEHDAIEIDKTGQVSFLTDCTWRKW